MKGFTMMRMKIAVLAAATIIGAAVKGGLPSLSVGSESEADAVAHGLLTLLDQHEIAAPQAGDLSTFVASLTTLLQSMLANIHSAVDALEGNCNASYSNLTTCPTVNSSTRYLPSGFDGDFTSLRQAHTTCRSEVVQQQFAYSACMSARENQLAAERAAQLAFHAVNVFNSPQECAVTTIGGDAATYFEAMVLHFTQEESQYWRRYNELKWISGNLSTTHSCQDKLNTLRAKHAECEGHQLALEQMACEVHTRTTEGCATVQDCPSSRWAVYKSIVDAGKETIENLKAEYRAVRRLECLVSTFNYSASAQHAKIDECIQTVWNTDVIYSRCVDGFSATQFPTVVAPDVCSTGVQSIHHPNTASFTYSEFIFHNVEYGECHATCCNRSFFTYTTLADKSVTQTDILAGGYATPQDAYKACEELSTVGCWGIYDIFCDGASAQQPLSLIKPGVNSSSFQGSTAGSCAIKMVNGGGYAPPAPPGDNCSFEVNISKSGTNDTLWKTLTLSNGLKHDDVPRFEGCTTEGSNGQACVTSGTTTGARVLRNRAGNGVWISETCCNEVTNKVLGYQKLSCQTN